jgi:hypothetical protein
MDHVKPAAKSRKISAEEKLSSQVLQYPPAASAICRTKIGLSELSRVNIQEEYVRFYRSSL